MSLVLKWCSSNALFQASQPNPLYTRNVYLNISSTISNNLLFTKVNAWHGCTSQVKLTNRYQHTNKFKKRIPNEATTQEENPNAKEYHISMIYATNLQAIQGKCIVHTKK